MRQLLFSEGAKMKHSMRRNTSNANVSLYSEYLHNTRETVENSAPGRANDPTDQTLEFDIE